MDIAQIGMNEIPSGTADPKLKSAEALATTQSISFSECLNTQNTENDVESESVETVSNESQSDTYDRYRYKENDVESAKEPTVSDKVAEAKDETVQFEKDMIAVISEDLNVDEEQVVEVMEALGLTAFDLLNPQNLAMLVKEIAGIADDAQLLLNADFKQLLSDVTALGKEFTEEIGLEASELETFAMEYASLQEAETSVEESRVIPDEENASAVPQQQEQQKSVEVVVEDNRTALQEDDAVENVQQPIGKVDEESTEQQQLNAGSDDGQQDGASSEQQSGRPVFTEQVTVAVNENSAAAVDAVSEPEMPSYTSVNAMDVIEQIVENVKISLDIDSTTMEMQLNPENLGKIYLNVTSREGTVSAQLYAQNEDVKIALEAQLATLTENLNQAGVKVDAVEVAVATHEFERNLEQNAKGEEEQGKNQEEKKSSRRSLRLDSLDELSGLMTEEETLIARIMKDNGNSVDFTA